MKNPTNNKVNLWVNLYLISLYINWSGMLMVIRLFMFGKTSGVFTFKLSLWGDQQIHIGINKFILMWLYDHLWLRPKRYLARMKS